MSRSVTRVLNEMRTVADIEAAPTLATVRRWIGLLEDDADDDPIVRSARAQARKDA